MTKEEKIRFLELMKISTEIATNLVEKDLENETAIISGYRILEILDEKLEYIKKHYINELFGNTKNVLDVEKKFLEIGVSPEDIIKYKQQITVEAYIDFSAILSDINSMDFGMSKKNYDENSEYMKLCDNAPSIALMEVVNGELTGRQVIELDKLISLDQY